MPSPLNDYINRLFQKYLDRSITDAELEELFIYLQGIKDSDATTLDEPLQQLWAKAKAGALPSTAKVIDWKAVYAKVTSAHQEQERQPSKVVTMRKRWIGVAAAAILLIAAGYLIYLKSGKSDEPIAKVETKTPEQILPGSSGAVLKLADGRTINLDSAKNGKLASQGSTQISNNNGQLIYTAGNDESVSENTLSTARGKKYQLQLPDGSLVWLNALSSITYPTAFTGSERNVSITGEAYFEVAKVAGQKFVVHYNNISTEVLGTHFNVNTYTDEASVKITLLEGLVKVSKDNKAVLLKPGEQAQVNATAVTSSEVNTDLAVAWVKGYLSFV